MGNEDEDEVEMQDEDDDEEGEEFELDDNDDKEEDDDDDESWKVRRSAIRALKAVAEAKKHDPSTLWNLLYKVRRGKTAIFASALVARFMEREENRRVDVIDGFTRLLTVTIKARLPFKFRTFICSRCCHGWVNSHQDSAPTSIAGASVTPSITAVAIDLRTQYAQCSGIIGHLVQGTRWCWWCDLDSISLSRTHSSVLGQG